MPSEEKENLDKKVDSEPKTIEKKGNDTLIATGTSNSAGELVATFIRVK